jgi:hypothetical protein
VCWALYALEQAMTTLKKSNTRVDIVFSDRAENYTNKLSAKNVSIEDHELSLDFTGYSKIKRNNTEETDFEKLQKTRNSIQQINIVDATVRKKLKDETVKSVIIHIDEQAPTKFAVSSYDSSTGFLT